MRAGFIGLAFVTAMASLTGCGTTAPAAPTARATPTAEGQPQVLEGMIKDAMRKHGIVGMSAVVLSGDHRLLRAGYGLADRSMKVAVTPDTVFPLASMTKLFTATAVMQLVERGEVDLDSPVSRYLPALAGSVSKARGAGPTVRQLLTHHAGLPGNIMEGFEILKRDPAAFREVPRVIGRTSAPDTIFAYSNAGYSLLGCLIEKVSGMAYADFVTRGILQPLDLSQTRFFLSPADAEETAMGYDSNKQVPVYPIRDLPAGALLSTGADMEKFMRFLFDQGHGNVLSSAAFTEMTSRQNGHVALDGDFSIGLGYWLIKPLAVPDAFASHAGDIPPFHAIMVTIPGKRIGIFLAANSEAASSALIPLAVELVRKVYSWQTGTLVEDPPPQPKVRLDNATLDGLAGNYASPMGLIEVHPRGGKLLARVMGLPLELIPRADDSFTAELSLLGVLSVPVSQLESLRISTFESSGTRYLRITTTGILAGVAERLPQVDVPQAWKDRSGDYVIVPQGDNASYRWPREISLRFDERTGLMLLSYLFPGQRLSFPLLFPDDAEAVIAGTGTNLGDRIMARDAGGDVFLEWSGMLLKRQ